MHILLILILKYMRTLGNTKDQSSCPERRDKGQYVPHMSRLVRDATAFAPTQVRADFEEWYKVQMANTTAPDLSSTQKSDSRARPTTGTRPPTAGADRPPVHRTDSQRSRTAPQPESGADVVGEDMRLFYEARNQLLNMKKQKGDGALGPSSHHGK